MKTKSLGNGEFDMVTSEIFIPGSAEKNAMVIGIAYYDPKDFNKEAMEKAFKELFRRNDIFRMRIVGKGFFKRQYIADNYEPIVSFHDIVGGREEFVNTCNTTKLPSIHLKDDILWKAEIYSCSDKTGGLILWQHHVISDGYSQYNILYSQLCELYVAYKNGEEPKEPKRIFTHDEYIDGRKKLLKKNGMKHMLLNIKDTWKYSFCYSLPFDGDYKYKPQAQHIVSFKEKEYEAFTKLCKELSCSVSCALIAIVSIMVNQNTGKKVFKLDTMTNGRSTFALKNTPGNLSTSIPIYMDFRKEGTAAEYIKSSYIEFLKNSSRIPFSAFIVSALLESIPCFTTLNAPWKNRWFQMNYLKFGNSNNNVLEVIPMNQVEEFLNIYLQVTDMPDGLEILFKHSLKIMNEETGKMIASQFKRLLLEIAEDPNRSIEQIYSKIIE